eukprot:2729686-Amphidinium_carterae.1
MVDIYLMRMAAREREAEVLRAAAPEVLETGPRWAPARRITRKRPRDELRGREDTVEQRDTRGRLSRRRTNLDTHRLEGARLQQQIRDSYIPPPAQVAWDLGPIKGATRAELRATPAHILPFVRHLGAREPATESYTGSVRTVGC